jgi:2',3'-cyclic-nucleotide 2'-phosphodiesterase (5'-nucleotidase family)
MPTLSEWLALTEKQRRDFLEDMERFDSYSEKACELANLVVDNLREKYNLNQAKITVGNKGGYLLIVAVLPAKEYAKIAAKNLEYYLGFNICYVKEHSN